MTALEFWFAAAVVWPLGGGIGCTIAIVIRRAFERGQA